MNLAKEKPLKRDSPVRRFRVSSARMKDLSEGSCGEGGGGGQGGEGAWMGRSEATAGLPG